MRPTLHNYKALTTIIQFILRVISIERERGKMPFWVFYTFTLSIGAAHLKFDFLDRYRNIYDVASNLCKMNSLFMIMVQNRCILLELVEKEIKNI